MQLHELNIRKTVELVSQGELSATEIARHFCDRIERLEPVLNAFAHFDQANVLLAASAIDSRVQQGEHLPLAGVTFTVKDNLWLCGYPATFGSKRFARFIASADSWCVARLKQLGALALGVTNCSEFACKGITESPLHGVTTNPWDTALTPGGSSGGAAACVAAGIGTFALATDAGGSTRRPAAHTGLVGMKPTLGAVPNPYGFEDPNHLLSVIGQIGQSVEDVAIVLHHLTDNEPSDPLCSPCFSHPRILEDFRNPMTHAKIGYVPDLSLGLLMDHDVKEVIEQTAHTLSDAGLNIDLAYIRWPSMPVRYPLLELQQAGLASLFADDWRLNPSLFDPVIAEQIELGLSVTGARLAELLRLKDAIHSALSSFFREYDFLICPTAPVEPWATGSLGPSVIGGQPASPRDHAAYTPLFNYAGVPAVSVPCGVGARGLPLGLQIVGAKYSDAHLLRLAHTVETLLGWSLRSPLYNT